MVRNYVKKGKESLYNETTLKNALHDVKCGHMTAYRAARVYNVPYATLYSHLKGSRGQIKKSKGRSTALPLELETKIATGVKTLEKWGFGLSRKEILSLVGKFVKLNKLSTPFKNSLPGEDWFIGFKKRHNLSIKKPQSVEFARRKATDPFIIFGYFNLLESTLDKLGIKDKPNSIWNLDESSLCIDPSKTKVVGAKGRSSSRITSGPARENTTILLMANAAGEKAPPLIIYKGVHMWDQWCAPEKTGYPGTVYAASKKGWMETEIFQNYFQHTLIPSLGENRPALIIYDGHSTHISPEIIDMAIHENITILKLPPHSSHLLQPLDLSVFKSFKDKWDAKLVGWQRQNIGRKLPKSLFSKFLGETWKSIPSQVIENGFMKAGIYPFDRTVIPNEKFCPEALSRWRSHCSSKSTIPNTQPSTSVNGNPNNDPSTSNYASTSATTATDLESRTLIINNKEPNNEIVTLNQPSTSTTTASDKQQNKTFENLLLEMVKQSPRPENTRRQRVGTGSEVLTSADVLNRLKKSKEQKANKNKKQQSKRGKKIVSSSDEEEDEEVEYEDSDNDEEFLKNLASEVEMQEYENNEFINQNLEENKWILVKYTSKKITKHFVGKIIRAVENEWEVTYLKRIASKRAERYQFDWPAAPNLDTITETDIVKILPEPLSDRRGLMYFNVQFDGYNL